MGELPGYQKNPGQFYSVPSYVIHPTQSPPPLDIRVLRTQTPAMTAMALPLDLLADLASPEDPVVVVYVRDLNEVDLAALAAAPEIGVKSSVIKEMRTRHHHLARLIAQGVTTGEASLISGYAVTTVSIFKQDPAFQELVAYYEVQQNDAFFELHRRLDSLGVASLDELLDRVENKPESFSHRELMEASELVLKYRKAPGIANAGGTAPVTLNINFTEPQKKGVVIEGEVIDG